MTRLTEPTNKFSISVAIAVFLFFYSVMISLPASSMLQDPDTFWHIRTGQLIFEHARFPVVDSYSYTAIGNRWIAIEWLSEIVFALAFKISEWRGVVILSAIATASIIATLCFYLLRILRFSIAIGWTALTALAMSPHYLARPHLFSYILLSVWLIILIDAYDSEDFRPSTVRLCILMILWANLHGSFTFGIALLYVFGGVSCYEKIVQRDYVQCRRLLFMLLAVSISGLLTPYGVYSALQTLEIMNSKFVQTHIAEWKSPDFQEYGILLFLFVALLTAMVGLGIRLRGPRLILVSMVMFLGLSHLRALGIFFLVTPIILARPVSAHSAWWRAAELTKDQSSEGAGAFDRVLLYMQKRFIAIPVMFLAAAVFVTAYSWRQLNIGPYKNITPNAAIDFVRSAGITGNVFNSYDFGGYLIFSGIPTFIDGRNQPFADNFAEKYIEASDLVDINNSFQLLDEYKVSWAILLPKVPLAKALAENARWNKAYSDEFSVVFVRRR
jgi:hypothetical protein